MAEMVDKLDELKEKYANARFDSIEMALSFSEAKLAAIRAKEEYLNVMNTPEELRSQRYESLKENDDLQRENPNMLSSLEDMDALNFNNLMQALEDEMQRITYEVDSIDDDFKIDSENLNRFENKELNKFDDKVRFDNKIRSFGSGKKAPDFKSKDNFKNKDSKKEEQIKNSNFIKQTADKNKLDEVDVKLNDQRNKDEDKREYELDNKYRSSGNKVKTSFDEKLEDAKLTSLSKKMIKNAASITHNHGRKVEFTVDKNSTLSFEKINGDTYAYKDGKQVDMQKSIDSLKNMLKTLDYNQTKSLEKVIKQVGLNPSVKDITKQREPDVKEKGTQRDDIIK